MPDELIKGLKRFKQDHFPRYKDHYIKIATQQQTPHTLFIGCADSRVVPGLITHTLPGDLFVVRNVGNLVPPFEQEDTGYHGVAAAIEYAVMVLKVKDIVICGHSHCGAIRCLYEPPVHATPHVDKWLKLAEKVKLEGPMTEDLLRQSERRSVVAQLEHLLTYAVVRDGLEKGDLALHGWHYVIEEGTIYILDIASGTFLPQED